MTSVSKDKLKHDFLNAIVIINSMTKSASTFINTMPSSMPGCDINQKQMEKFLYSMNTIREQTTKIEHYFLSLLEE